MNIENLDFNKYLNVASSRHHYIPRFLINGFLNKNGALYIYDKKKDNIIKKERSSKSIFFENDRNTVDITDEIRSSIIEDLLYKDIDNKTCNVIRKYQTEDLSKIDFNIDDSAHMLIFLISLFWRLPKTDYAVNDLIDRAEITSEGIDSETLRNDETFRKMSRNKIFLHTIDEIIRNKERVKKWENLHQNENAIYVLGDYPIVFRKEPREFRKFDDIDMLIAVSSRRIFSSTKDKLSSYPIKNSFLYNLCVIEQSENYVISEDLNLLEQTVISYKKLKLENLTFNLKECVFHIS